MTPEQIAEQEAATAAAKAAEEAVTSHDPLRGEVEKIQKKTTRTELEKAEFSLKRTADRVKELGGDPSQFFGNPIVEEDDNKPVTVGMLKNLQTKEAQQTALQLADSINDDNERTLVKHHLSETIKPSGNPQEDLAAARAIVNAKRNSLIAEEAQRKSGASTHVSGAGAPARPDSGIFEPTQEEQAFMRPPFNLTKEAILKARQQ